MQLINKISQLFETDAAYMARCEAEGRPTEGYFCASSAAIHTELEKARRADIKDRCQAELLRLSMERARILYGLADQYSREIPQGEEFFHEIAALYVQEVIRRQN